MESSLPGMGLPTHAAELPRTGVLALLFAMVRLERLHPSADAEKITGRTLVRPARL